MISGRTFPYQKVPAAAHGAVFRGALSDGILSGCDLSFTGKTLTIGKGLFIEGGREVEVTAAETLSVTQTSGYARVKAVINTAAESNAENFQQFSWAVDYSTNMSGFAALTREDINLSGTNYEMELCVLALSSAGISSIARAPAKAHGKAGTATATLSASGWSGNLQTVSVEGVTAGNLVFTSPNAESWESARDNGVRCIGQGEGSLTFQCDSEPSGALGINIAILN